MGFGHPIYFNVILYFYGIDLYTIFDSIGYTNQLESIYHIQLQLKQISMFCKKCASFEKKISGFCVYFSSISKNDYYVNLQSVDSMFFNV